MRVLNARGQRARRICRTVSVSALTLATVMAATVGVASAQFDPVTSAEPPGVGTLFGLGTSWGLWLAGAAAVISLIGIGIAVIVGRRNRSQGAADAFGHMPWVFGGAILATSAPVLAQALF